MFKMTLAMAKKQAAARFTRSQTECFDWIRTLGANAGLSSGANELRRVQPKK